MKNLFWFGAGFLLAKFLSSKKTTNYAQLKNDARLLVGNGDEYKATFFSDKPLNAELLKQNNAHNYTIKLQGNIADDFVKISGLPVVY